jgi:hypothetical protein
MSEHQEPPFEAQVKEPLSALRATDLRATDVPRGLSDRMNTMSSAGGPSATFGAAAANRPVSTVALVHPTSASSRQWPIRSITATPSTLASLPASRVARQQ